MTTRDRIIAIVYTLWTITAVGLAFLVGGLSDDNITRVLVIGFLIVQLAALRWVRGPLARIRPRVRFVATGMLLAAVVEGFYMVSRPVFPSLRITAETDLRTGMSSYALDLALTLPAYFVIFSVIWWWSRRYRYTLWEYVLIMGMGQALGDGFVYFVGAPAMLLFLPYPMLNYHAINILPFLVTRSEPEEPTRSWRRLLALPILVVVYLVCGGVIALIGGRLGLS
ncbi:MAG: hypothetical protein ABI867_00185 [Kofleriaceae bacterium]